MRIVLVIISTVLTFAECADNDALAEEERQWQAWNAVHSASSSSIGLQSDSVRRANFHVNYQNKQSFMQRKTSGDPNADFDVTLNKWADLARGQVVASRMGYRSSRNEQSYGLPGNTNNNSRLNGLATNPPASIDWRRKGAVTPAQNQDPCSVCYAFAAVAAIEGRYQIKTGRLRKFSEQQVIDCSQQFGNDNDCYGVGGNPDKVFKYIASVGGIQREVHYPYLRRTHPCQFNKTRIYAKLASPPFVDLVSRDETSLMVAVAEGPVTASIDASQWSFMFYKSGIFSDASSCGKTAGDLTHAVLIVGYGTDRTATPPKPYWIIKNSWGNDWGENGFGRILRGVNLCGIATDASYPVIADIL